MLHRAAQSSRKAKLSHIVSENTVDVVEFCAGYRLLRLYDLDIVRYSSLKLLTGQSKRLPGNFQIFGRDAKLIRCRLHVEISISHITLDPGVKVFELSLTLRKRPVPVAYRPRPDRPPDWNCEVAVLKSFHATRWGWCR